MPGCIPFDRTTDPEPLGELLAQAARARRAVRRRRLALHRSRARTESSADVAARLEAEIGHLLSAVHTVQRGSSGSVKLPGGLWIVTERAVATESGEPVDPVQAALWGFGRTTINEEPALRCRLVDCDGSPEAVHCAGQPAGHTGRRAGTRAATREAAGLPAAAVGAQRSSHGAARQATTSWRPPSAARSTTCV